MKIITLMAGSLVWIIENQNVTCDLTIVNNYSPKWRWLVVDISEFYEPRKNGTTRAGVLVAHACSLVCWRRDNGEAGNSTCLIASPLRWLRLRKPLQKGTFLSSDYFFFILYRLSTIFANKFSIHTWMTRERDEQTALFWVHISMTTTPRASKLISFKSIAELKEFTGFVGQFVILFSTWTYSLFTTTTVLYTRKSFQVKRFNSQFVNSFWFAKARVFSGR